MATVEIMRKVKSPSGLDLFQVEVLDFATDTEAQAFCAELNYRFQVLNEAIDWRLI